MKKLLLILFVITLFSCKKASTANSSNATSSSWTINGASYNITSSNLNLVGFWSATDNMVPNSLQVLASNIGYSPANTSINSYTHDGNNFCLAIAFKNRPTTSKTYSICAVTPYSVNYGSDIVNTNTNNSTCVLVGSLFSDLSGDYWFSNNANNTVNVTVNNGQIIASFNNVSLVYHAIYGDGSTNYTTVSGTLIEGK